jgi:hypothetical protein
VLPLAVPVVLAGCGPAGTGAGTGDRPAALANWQSFPAEANPRPLVMMETVLDPRTGFASGEDKVAFSNSAFDLAVTLPPAPASAHGYPVVSASAALDRLRAASMDDEKSTPRLRIVKATLGQARFGTDRGPQLLPAWRFGLDHVADPVWVLAVGSTALWPFDPTSAADPDFHAISSPDGRTLSLDFIGGPDEPTPCGIAYTAVAVESATAVALQLQASPQRRVDGSVFCTLVGYRRTVTLGLATPLGGRVLLNPGGAPIPVTSR